MRVIEGPKIRGEVVEIKCPKCSFLVCRIDKVFNEIHTYTSIVIKPNGEVVAICPRCGMEIPEVGNYLKARGIITRGFTI